jgi:hypothetical protein
MLRLEMLSLKDGKIACACCHIENALRLHLGKHLYGSVAPQTVYVPREAVVESVIGGGDVVEHSLHLCFLLAFL